MDDTRSASPLAASPTTPAQGEQQRLKPLSLKTSHVGRPQRKKSSTRDGHRKSRVCAAGIACWEWISAKCSNLLTLETSPQIDAIPGAPQPSAANYSVACTDGLDLSVVLHY